MSTPPATAPDGSPLVTALNGSTVEIDNCTYHTCSLVYAQLQYRPSVPADLAYLIIFAIVLLAQMGLGFVYRTWGFLIGMCCGLLLEIVGYVGRVGLHSDPITFGYFVT